MRYYIIIMAIISPMVCLAQAPSTDQMENLREYKIKLLKMWSESKYQNCPSILAAAENARLEVTTANQILRSNVCGNEVTFSQPCFDAVEESDLGTSYSKIAADYKCKLKASEEKIFDVNIVCKTNGKMTAEKDYCSQDVKCTNNFSVGKKKYEKGTFLFYVKKGADSKCPSSFYASPIQWVRKKGVMGFGGGKPEYTGSEGGGSP